MDCVGNRSLAVAAQKRRTYRAATARERLHNWHALKWEYFARSGANYGSEQDVEIHGKAAVALAEKDAITGIGDVIVDGFRVEMVGKVEARERQAHFIFGSHGNIFGNA